MKLGNFAHFFAKVNVALYIIAKTIEKRVKDATGFYVALFSWFF